VGLAIWLPIVAGCATYADQLHELRDDFYGGRLEDAEQKIAKRLDRPRGDGDVLQLERSLVELCSGRPKQAEQTLRDVRDRFEHLEQKSVAEFGLAMLTDDKRLAYAGEDYEKVLIRVFLSLANLMHDGGDAYAYALQVNDKQNQIIEAGANETGQNPKLAYKRVAVGAYLHGALCEQTHSSFDDVARSYSKVVSWQPEFPFGRADFERGVSGRHSAPGNGVLYVFTLVGRGPFKAEVLEVPTTVALLVADRIVTATGKHSLPPTIAPIKVPLVMRSPNRVENVQVFVNGQHAGRTETITDIGSLAVQQYEAVYPQILGRAVARRALKKAIVYGGKEVAGISGSAIANLLMDVGGVAWEATEAADTRCWGLLPNTIQVLRLELPAGTHQIALMPTGSLGTSGRREEQSVTIVKGRNTYMLANFPDNHIAGQILANTP